MSQQLLGDVTAYDAGTVAAAVESVARSVAAPPSLGVVAATCAACWPMRDPESLRGAALLAESQLAGERLERLLADYSRLFVGSTARPAITSPLAPVAAEPALTRLREEVTGAAVLLPSDPGRPALGLAQALQTFAAVLAAEETHAEAARWRRQLVEEHLLTWGARSLSRAQLGAQTFYYQGVAALGLGLLRWAAAQRAH